MFYLPKGINMIKYNHTLPARTSFVSENVNLAYKKSFKFIFICLLIGPCRWIFVF